MKKLTSDLHFRHRNICNYTDRSKVTNSELHDQWVTNLWNSEVDSHDEVWHMGDFCFSAKYEVVRDIVQRLNGKKYFIIGNHDKEENFRRLRQEGLIEWYGHYREIYIGDNKACLMHFPIAAWHRQHYGSWHLHGHTHAGFQGQGKSLDVGLDMSYKLFGEHRFFTEQDIAEFMQERTIHVADSHKAKED